MKAILAQYSRRENFTEEAFTKEQSEFHLK
jgi:hypothetical protein